MRELETELYGKSEEAKINSFLGETKKGSRKEMALKSRLRMVGIL